MDRTQRSGFTLVEMAIALVVVLVLVAVAVPTIGGLRAGREVERILGTIDRLRDAVHRHYADTGVLAVEFSGPDYAAAEFHRLSRPQPGTSWNGPYIDAPLDASQNPFGGFVFLFESFAGGVAVPHGKGFRPGGPRGRAATGAGQFVAFGKIPESIARKVDEALDAGLSGDWRRDGRVQFSPARGGTLMVFLMDA